MQNGGCDENEEAMRELTRIDDTRKKLQSQGYNREAMDCMQLGLLKRHEMFGPNSSEFVSHCELVVNECNKLALKNSGLGSNFNDTVELLNFALKIAKPNQLASTLQNFAQVHTGKGEYAKALKYLERAAAVEEAQLEVEEGTNEQLIEHAKTHLNTCAILSMLGKHNEALAHSNHAIQILRQKIQNKKESLFSETDQSLSNSNKMTTSSIMSPQAFPVEEEKLQEYDNDLMTLQEVNNIENFEIEFIEALAISYFNAGVEAEHLGRYKKCYYLLQQGVKVAQFLDVNHRVIKSLNESCQAIMKKLGHHPIEQDHKFIYALNNNCT
jgi:tetratricopeptide (TPR) repeat protein